MKVIYWLHGEIAAASLASLLLGVGFKTSTLHLASGGDSLAGQALARCYFLELFFRELVGCQFLHEKEVFQIIIFKSPRLYLMRLSPLLLRFFSSTSSRQQLAFMRELALV